MVLTMEERLSRSAFDPKYDYEHEAQLVIERLADTATNDTKKMLIEFFDDKGIVALAINVAMAELLDWTFEECM